MFQVRVREERKCCRFVSAVYSRHGGCAATRVYTGYGRQRGNFSPCPRGGFFIFIE